MPSRRNEEMGFRWMLLALDGGRDGSFLDEKVDPVVADVGGAGSCSGYFRGLSNGRTQGL